MKRKNVFLDAAAVSSRSRAASLSKSSIAGRETVVSNSSCGPRTKRDPLKDEPCLREAAIQQAKRLVQEPPRLPITAMEFCLQTIWERMGLYHFGVGQRQRIVLSQTRKEVLGIEQDKKMIQSPQSPPISVKVPSFDKFVKEIINDSTIDNSTQNTTAMAKTEESCNFKQRILQRIEKTFDSKQLLTNGILYLPKLVSIHECCEILSDLSLQRQQQKEEEQKRKHHPQTKRKRSQCTYLRKSSGNGEHGYYQTIDNRTIRLLGEALAEVLYHHLHVFSGNKSLLLHYTNNGINYAHQDQSQFPYQALLLLSRPTIDFCGGQFYVTDPTSLPSSTLALSFVANNNFPTTHAVEFQTMGDVVIFAANTNVIHSSSSSWYHGMKKVLPGTNGEENCNRIAVGLLQS